MAQQDTTAAGSGTAVAGASLSGDQLHFLTQTQSWGVDHSPELGFRRSGHSVIVFQEDHKLGNHLVTLCIRNGDFKLQEYLNADEARVLAAALLLAADHAESRNLDHDIDVAMKAAKVAA